MGTPVLPEGVQHLFPFRPGPRRRREPGVLQEIATVEQEARVDVPRDAIQLALDPVRVPDTSEVVVRLDDRRRGREPIEWFERVQRHEFRDPGVPQLAEIGSRVPGKRGEELFVGRRPRQLLDLDVDVGMCTFELGQELGDHLTLAAHGPEPDDGVARGRRVATRGQRQCSRYDKEDRPGPQCFPIGLVHGATASQPPEKPACSRPRRRYGFLRMTRQIRALR